MPGHKTRCKRSGQGLPDMACGWRRQWHRGNSMWDRYATLDFVTGIAQQIDISQLINVLYVNKRLLERYDIAIIGGGILGTCISYWISSLFDTNLCLLEKEPDVAMHASGRNTGVVHSPFYIHPGTRKVLTKASVLSHNMWEHLAKSRSVPWKKTGVLELALDEKQHGKLEKYMKWGERNGIPPNSLNLLDAQQVSDIEPNIRCHSAIHCGCEVSTDFGHLTKTLRHMSANNGTNFLLGTNVTDINRKGCQISLKDGPDICADFVINCAGGNSLDVARMFGLAMQYSDLHFRGEYWVADSGHKDLVGSTVYTVAEFEKYPFLDPHWIKRADGRTEVGPNAVPVPSPETYSGYLGDVATSVAKLGEILTGNALKLFYDPEFLSLISREWLSSISKTAMIDRVRRFIPHIKPEFFPSRGTAGIRSPVITPEGKFLPDVMEIEDECSFHIVNYNSPGATGAPAYSAFVVNRLYEAGFLGSMGSPKDVMWDFADTINQY